MVEISTHNGRKDATGSTSKLKPSKATNVSRYLTPFVGRTAEVTELIARLDDPICRLLTLVGPGGIGKTRLALQIVAQLNDRGSTAHFVDLQPVESTQRLIAAIADALDLPDGSGDPLTQLQRALQDKELVLVLDNFEHLLHSAEIVADLLQSAPEMTILITSRTVLQLHGEWQYHVDGLSFPPATVAPPATAQELATYDAVAFFVTCAQRVRLGFQLDAEAEGVLRVCQIVEGMPLALELAAVWANTMTAAAIADEIQADLDFLATSLRNIPEKHRSMQVVLERWWQLLEADERTVFKRLSVFRGGFDRAAAIYVAGASLPTLAALVDKSFLRWRSNDRYDIHLLLRQYAEEQLAQSAEELAHTQALHSSYYAAYLGERTQALTTQQRTALFEIKGELDNIRAGWQWATSQKRLEDIKLAVMPFFAFCQGQSRYREGAESLAAAYTALSTLPPTPDRDSVLADLLTGRGWLELRLGRMEEAANTLETAHRIYSTQQLAPPPLMGADPLPALVVLTVGRGEYAAGAALGKEAWQAAAARGDNANLALAGYGLTSAAIAQGEYEEALTYARKTLSLTKALDGRWFTAYVYNQLGLIMQMLNDVAAAKEYYQASYAIREEFDDPEGMGVALNRLGEILLLQEEFEEAQATFQRGLTCYQGIGDQAGLIKATYGIGLAAHRLADAATARQYLQEALQLAAEMKIAPLILHVLFGVGIYLLESGAEAWGRKTLYAIQQHPASNEFDKQNVQQILATASSNANSTAHLKEREASETFDLDRLIGSVLAELSRPLDQVEREASFTKSRQQALIDPLSEREMEVLKLIAAGLKNREIAQRLYVTLSTVKAHGNSIYRKLDVNSRVQAIARAQKLDLLQ